MSWGAAAVRVRISWDNDSRCSAVPYGVVRLGLPLLLLALPVVTYANAGDPKWIRGLSDGADYDGLVSAAGSPDGMIASPVPNTAAWPFVIEKVIPPDCPEVTVAAPPSAEPRAPPDRRATRSARGSWSR